MLLKVVKYGDPTLEVPTQEITKISDDINQLIEDMKETMYDHDGVGLAANQIGSPLRLAIIDTSAGEDPEKFMVLINPVITHYSEEEEEMEEGCLSFPEVRFNVFRPSAIIVEALDLDGKKQVYELEDMLARIFQHEIDHLDGKVFIRFLHGLSKQMVLAKIKNMKKWGEWD
jgi:peptide deformylase